MLSCSACSAHPTQQSVPHFGTALPKSFHTDDDDHKDKRDADDDNHDDDHDDDDDDGDNDDDGDDEDEPHSASKAEVHGGPDKKKLCDKGVAQRAADASASRRWVERVCRQLVGKVRASCGGSHL